MEEEIISRIGYIYDVFHIYILKDNNTSTNRIAVFNGIPNNKLDLLFIVGHDRLVEYYISKHYKEIKEQNIVVLSCNTNKFKSLELLKGKNIYVPKKEGRIETYEGRQYGFNFNMTNEEILAYRNREKGIEELLNKVFKRR